MPVIEIDDLTQAMIDRMRVVVDATYEAAPLTDSEIVRASLTAAFLIATAHAPIALAFEEAFNDAKYKMVESIFGRAYTLDDANKKAGYPPPAAVRGD